MSGNTDNNVCRIYGDGISYSYKFNHGLNLPLNKLDITYEYSDESIKDNNKTVQISPMNPFNGFHITFKKPLELGQYIDVSVKQEPDYYLICYEQHINYVDVRESKKLKNSIIDYHPIDFKINNSDIKILFYDKLTKEQYKRCCDNYMAFD